MTYVPSDALPPEAPPSGPVPDVDPWPTEPLPLPVHAPTQMTPTQLMQPVYRNEPAWPTAEEPRKLRARTVDDKASVIGAMVAALALAWIITEQLIPVHGWFGLVVCWYFLFLAFYAGVTSIGNSRTVVVDRLVSGIVHGGAVLVGAAIVLTIGFIFWKGAPALPHWNFYSDDMAGVRENDPLSHGGILHAIIGSTIEIAHRGRGHACRSVSVPRCS